MKSGNFCDGKAKIFPSSRVFRQQDQTQSQRVNRQIRNFITKNNFTFSFYRCLFFVWLRCLWEWMRKIHLPTSIKQTKFVSRIQAYRSSVYLQGFRGFTFSSTQSRQTKAESYVKPKAPAATKQFQVRRIFFTKQTENRLFPFRVLLLPPSPTPFMRAVLSFTQFHLIDIFIVMCWKVLFCVRLLRAVYSHKRFIRMERHSNVFISILFAYPQIVYCTKLVHFLSPRRLHRVWIGFILVHETILPLLVLVFCYLEHTRSPYEIYYSWFCMSELRLIHTMRRRRRRSGVKIWIYASFYQPNQTKNWLPF